MTQYKFGGDTLIFEYSSDSGNYVSEYLINGVVAVVEFGDGVWELNNADGSNFGRSASSYFSADDACPSQIAWEIWAPNGFENTGSNWTTPAVLRVGKNVFTIFYRD